MYMYIVQCYPWVSGVNCHQEEFLYILHKAYTEQPYCTLAKENWISIEPVISLFASSTLGQVHQLVYHNNHLSVCPRH